MASGFDRDMLTRLQLMAEGRVAVSDIDADRRIAIMRRRPEKFAQMTSDQKQNFVTFGLSNRDGQLDTWLSQHRPRPPYRNEPQLGKGGVFLIDHLPRRNLAYPPVQVPWTGAEYIGSVGQFLEYPELMGFDREALERGNFGLHERDEGLAFLQSWLFFGLWKEFFGDKSEVIYKWWVRSYTSADITTKYMMSPYLAKYLSTVKQRLSQRDRPPWEYVEAILQKACIIAEVFDNVFADEVQPWDYGSEPISLTITWSILMLGQMLTSVALVCYEVGYCSIRQWPDGQLLHRRLQLRRWCPHFRHKLMGLLTIDAIYLLSLMPWHYPVDRSWGFGSATKPFDLLDRAPQDYSIGIDRHRECTVQKCLGEQVDEATYETAHVNQDCKCSWLGPDIGEVIKVLDVNEVPVFRVMQSLDTCGVLHISVVVIPRTRAAEGYVAFSHVWADGLGNKADNKLPICQIIWLAQLVRDLTGEDYPAFWIDTFGVPRKLEHRKKAIAIMNVTYRLSKKVLVLDEGLQQFNAYRALDSALNAIDFEIAEQIRISCTVELMLRILCSSWTSRLWTLPEGMLGPEAHFQFADGAVELGELYAQLKTWPFIGTTLTQDLRSFFIRLRPLLRSQSRLGMEPEDPGLRYWPSGSLAGRFITMFSTLEWRDTSWKEDEAICLGIHLGVNMDLITSRPDNEKLEGVLLQLDHVPTDLLFTHGTRVSSWPFQWAPLHFLEHKDNYCCIPAALPNTPMGRRTDRGLFLKCKSFQLCPVGGKVPLDRFIYFTCFHTNEHGQLRFYPDIPVEEQQTWYCMQLASTDPRDSPMWTESKLAPLLAAGGEDAVNVYILVGPEHMHGPPADLEPGKVCLIIKRVDWESGVTYGTPLDTVVVFQMPRTASVRPELQNSESFVHWKGIALPATSFVVG